MTEKIYGVEARPTREDVATLAKVSGTTVSRVLGGRPDESVSTKARQRVLDAARALGYTPNSAAKALRSGRSGLVGLWMCLEFSLYRSQVLAEVRRILAETDFALSVNDVDQDYASHHSLDRALRVPAEGIIAFEPSIASEAYVDAAVKGPFVSMGAFCLESRSHVVVDLRAGTDAAMDHLLASGRKKIAYVGPKGTYFATGGERFNGYVAKMTAAGLEPRSIEILDDSKTRVESLKAVLTEQLRPEALLCFYDDMAVDAVDALQQLGLTPGLDVAVVGFNGQVGLERGPFPISTVRQPIERMCDLAFQFLKNQIDHPSAPLEKVVLKPELIVRRSSAF